MNDITHIAGLFGGGAEYLCRTRFCDEDRLPHGRRSYAWPLLRWLYRHDGNNDWRKKAERIADELYPTVRPNAAGETVIFPGLHHRRNYSTNAIDCGTFVDSFYDFAEMRSGEPHPLAPKVREVALSYLLKKITGRKDVHDQYLWAATGLARYLREHEGDPRAGEYRSALETTLDFWVSHHERDGYSPYMNSDPYMGGLTPYYFSRRIAFAWYILEQARLQRSDIREKLLTATRFLATLFRPDGTKEMLLEAKRYYFWGSYEADSHPFDIYAFSKAYEQTRNEFWLDISAVSLRKLMDAELSSGAIRSRARERGVRDWQCDTMRTGHLAWLTRLSDDCLAAITERNVCRLNTPYPFSAPPRDSRVLLIGNAERWVHLVVRKGKLAGHAGERSSGLLIPTGTPVTDLCHPCLFQYRARGNPLRFLQYNWPALIATFQYAIFHVWDCLYHKRAFPLAWAFFRDGFLGFISTGLFTRSTEFATELSNLSVGAHWIRHGLTLSDVGGQQTETIGRREMCFDKDAGLRITDTIIDGVRVRLALPEGPVEIRGPRIVNITYRIPV